MLQMSTAPSPPPVMVLMTRVRARWAPPPTLKVSEFANLELIVTSGPLAGTRMQTSFAPYQVGILDAFHEPRVQFVIVKGSSQWGKTLSATVIVAYHCAHDPCSILVVEPTVDPMAKDFSTNRMDPMIDASPILQKTFTKKRSKDATRTVLNKTFQGGFLAMAGANSAASLAARPTRLLVLDEVDRYPAELPGEGSTLEIAFKRTTAFGRRRRILMLSSPTLRGAPIDAWHARGDQRRYYVPCPSCGVMHPFMWKQVRWVNRDPSTARLHCPACDHPIDEAERVAILGRGEWRAENPTRADKTIVSFHVWEAYSPLSSLEAIVAGFLRAREAQKAGDSAPMHTWENTTLGEAIEPDAGDGVEAHVLLLRRERYLTETGEDLDCPADVCCLTMGVDVQDDRLEALVWGWGVGEESWLIDRLLLPGDTSQPEPWKQLDDALEAQYLHASGEKLTISATCIDSAGHRTTEVYDYALRQAAKRVYATIGRDDAPLVSSPSARGRGRHRRKVLLYTVGVDTAKALFMSRLRLTEKGRGYVHLPSKDWCDDELADQLTSERLVMRIHKGVPHQVWKKVRTRNEGLDCSIYALAALRLLNPNFEALAHRLNTTVDRQPPPAAPVKRQPWLGRRPGGWMKR
jgi:phage terminase large subunit GpA-like protein